MSARRASPLGSQLVLWLCFGAIAITSVFTVLVPELSDDGEAQEQTQDVSHQGGDSAN